MNTIEKENNWNWFANGYKKKKNENDTSMLLTVGFAAGIPKLSFRKPTERLGLSQNWAEERPLEFCIRVDEKDVKKIS